MLAAGVGTGKQVILSTQRDCTQRALGGVVIDFQVTVIEIARKCGPTRQCIADRNGKIDFFDTRES